MGVLPVCLGKATRVVEYLVEARKTYIATVLLGAETDTYDLSGTVTGTADTRALVSEDVTQALANFRGEIEQTPPAFSALKRQGVPLYKLARAGKAVAPSPRRVTIYRLDLLALDLPSVTFEVECSKGTYIRSIAHDLGRLLGVGGSLASLERIAVGRFRIEDAIAINALEREFATGTWQEKLLAADEVLLDWPAAIVAEENAKRIVTGRFPQWTAAKADSRDRCRAYSLEGDFLAVLRRDDGGGWRPEKVFSGASG